jgi:hypothetical protein
MNGGPAVKTPILDTRAYNAVLNLVTNDLQARTRKRVLPSDWAPDPRPTDIRAGLPALLEAARHHGADLRCITHGLKGSRKTLAHILALAPELMARMQAAIGVEPARKRGRKPKG